MKRIILALSLVLLFVVVGCNADKTNGDKVDNQNKEKNINEEVNTENEPNNKVENEVDLVENDEENVAFSEESEALSLQLTKIDQDAGVTVENSEIYQELNAFVEQNPDYGDPNDFSVYVVESMEDDGEYNVVLLAINRLDQAVKNVSFKYTFGTKSGEFVFEKEPVLLGEEEFGVIQPHHAIPFMLEVTKEEAELMQEMDESNTVIEFHDVDLEYADIEDALALQVTKVDEGDGITIANNEVYQELDLYVKGNPTLGDEDDFSVYVINTLENDKGQHLILLAINRLDKPLKNVRFDYTLGKDTGEFIFKEKLVDLNVEDFGEIKVNHAMPFTLQVDDEQLELMSLIDETNQVVEFHNFDFEYAK